MSDSLFDPDLLYKPTCRKTVFAASGSTRYEFRMEAFRLDPFHVNGLVRTFDRDISCAYQVDREMLAYVRDRKWVRDEAIQRLAGALARELVSMVWPKEEEEKKP